jgi:hypothetical protein
LIALADPNLPLLLAPQYFRLHHKKSIPRIITITPMISSGHRVLEVTLEVVAFKLDKMDTNATDENENSTKNTLHRLANLVNNNIGCHTDDFVLWNEYARACLKKGGNDVNTFSLLFKNKNNIPIFQGQHLSLLWCVDRPDNETVDPMMISFFKHDESQNTRFYDMRRALQQAGLFRGYLIAMTPMYLQGTEGEEDGLYYHEPHVIEVTNDNDALVCGRRTENEQYDSMPTTTAKHPFPFVIPPMQHPAPPRRRIRSGIVPKKNQDI